MLNHLIEIKNLDNNQIDKIIEVAELFKANKLESTVKEKAISLIFCENSTRTKCSFEMAAKKLKMNVIHFDASTSSLNKGETLFDTLENLYFMGINGAVIRHSENKIYEELLTNLNYDIKIINGGNGNQAHPTQALLDYFTMKEHFKNLKGKKIVIVGDIAHSRVANSNAQLLSKIGAEVVLCAPDYFTPADSEFKISNNLKESAKNADVIMGLRIQRERFQKEFSINFEDYIKEYQINEEIFSLANENSLLMHPGPVNRGVEISESLLNSEKGKTILKQVENGIYVRMAVLELLLGENNYDF